LPGEIHTFFNHDCIFKEERIIIVESPIDCIILTQHGFPAIASMGVNSIRVKRFKDLIGKQVLICFDQDQNNAGLSGAISVSNLFNDYKINHKMIVLPKEDGKNDVAKYFKTHSKKDFKKLIDAAIDVSTLKSKKQISEVLSVDGQHKMPCPFHDDVKPSLVIYYDTQSYYCFGCGKYGPISEIR
jgi:DNA primase